MTDSPRETRTEPSWIGDLYRHLGTGPLSVQKLARRLRKDHPRLTTREVVAELEDRDDLYEGETGWVSLLALADGAMFTHVVTEKELDHGVLRGDYDLALWARLAIDGLPFAGGGEIRSDMTEHAGALLDACVELSGPEGWLTDCQPGLIGLRLDSGTLELVPGSEIEPADIGAAGERVAQMADVITEYTTAALSGYLKSRDEDGGVGPFVPMDFLIAETLIRHPGLFNEQMPLLGLMLKLGGFEVEHGTVGLPGVDWDLDDLSATEVLARVSATTFIRMLGTEGADVTADDVEAFFGFLGMPSLLEYAADLVEREPLDSDALAAVRAATTTPRQRALLALLAARSAQGDGDPEAAEHFVTVALGDDPDLVPALLDAADYAATRGDLVAADAHLRRAQAPRSHPLRTAISLLQAPTPSAVGRNQPCPCGSGRKYKVCHLPRQTRQLADRAALAYTRLGLWMQRSANRPIVDEYAAVIDEEIHEGGLLATNLALFDGSRIGAYLDERAGMLPDDERDLMSGWVAAPMAAYEVTAIERGDTVTLRPLLGGDEISVRERGVVSQLRRLDLLVGVVLDDGERPRIIAPMTQVPRSRRAELVGVFANYSPELLVAFFRPQPPPRLTNRDGHEMVFGRADYEVPAAGLAWTRLAESLEEFDRNRLDWLNEIDGDRVLAGSVSRNGRVWTVEANSIERLRGLQEIVLAAAPGAKLVSESTEPARLPGPESRPARTITSGALPDAATDPEVRAAVEEHLRQYQQRWLDMSIPALGGRTPRQAAAEGGTTRAELAALLDDFEHSGGPMDVDWMRAALGLA